MDTKIIAALFIGGAALALITIILDRAFDRKFAPKPVKAVRQVVKRQLPDCFVWDLDVGEDLSKVLLTVNK